jgi:sulfur carrier protein ThiS
MVYRINELTVNGSKIELKVAYKGEEKALQLDEGSTVEDLLRSLRLYIDAHIVMSGNRALPSTDQLHNGQELRIIQVASGG